MLPGLSSFPHWLVSSPRCWSQTSQQSCWSSYTENEGSIVEVFPSITCVTIVRTWKRFLTRTCKFLDFTLFTGFAHVKARPPLLFLCDTVTLMAILLCCTPRRDSYRIQHSDNWCLVRIRSNWCRCLDLGCLQETVGACY